MRYQSYRYVTVVTTTQPFIEGDDPIRSTHRERWTGEVIEAADRAEALAINRAAHGLCAAGVVALDVDCDFCEDRPVGNAERWTDASAPATAACPRCGASA